MKLQIYIYLYIHLILGVDSILDLRFRTIIVVYLTDEILFTLLALTN